MKYPSYPSQPPPQQQPPQQQQHQPPYQQYQQQPPQQYQQPLYPSSSSFSNTSTPFIPAANSTLDPFPSLTSATVPPPPPPPPPSFSYSTFHPTYLPPTSNTTTNTTPLSHSTGAQGPSPPLPQPNVPMPLYPKAMYGSTASLSMSTDSLANSFSHLGLHQPILAPLGSSSSSPTSSSSSSSSTSTPMAAPTSTLAATHPSSSPHWMTMTSLLGGSGGGGGYLSSTTTHPSMTTTPHSVHDPPPPSRLSSQACCTPSPYSNCSITFQRCTLQVIPQSPQLLNQLKIPLALYIAPFRDPEPNEPPIPVINASTIVRCRRCRTYINPYVQFLDKGQRWKCNLCYFPNDVPESFDVDALHHTVLDRWKRPELNHAVVEFVAPSEYMLRPPQPPTFLFIVDVSMGSVQSGFLRTCCQTLTLSLHQLPNADLRTLVGLITVDASSLHFYQLTSNEDHEKRFNPNDGVQMLVVSDLDDVFLPAPEGVFVNLDECKRSFLHLLSILPDVHASSSSSSSSSSPCQLKPALQAGYQLMQSIGGKITVFLTNNPSPFQIDGLSGASSGFFPSSSLQDKKKNVSSSSSTSSSSSSSSFYKKFAVDCYLCQISVDLFLMEFTTSSLSFPSRNGSSTSMPPPPPSSSSSSSHFPDLPSMICVPKFTAGHVYMYPDFHVASPAHVEKFQREVHHYLGRALGLEAVMRVRASRGLRTTTYHGHFFVRSNDLLALPNVSPDHTYCIEIQLEETLNTAVVCFQTALLHTTAFGERRIRVLTLALPVSNQLNDVVASLDAGALLCCLARKAVERVHESSALDAREAIVNKCCDVLTHFPGSPQLMCPLYLRMFPLLCLGLTKHLALRTLPSSSSTFLDHQTFAMTQLNTCCIESLITQCHPLVYAIHSMYSPSSSSSLGGLEKTRTHDPPPPGGGAWSASTGGPLDDPTYRGNQGQGQGQGQVLPVTSERFERHGMYIVYNGTVICLWISRCVPSELLYALFDVHHFAEVKDGPFLIPVPFQTTEEGEKGEMTDPSSSAPSPDQQALMSSAPSSSFPSTTMDPTPTHLRPPSTYDAAAALVFKKKVFSFIHQLRLRALALSTCWPVCMVVKEESPTELRNVVLRMLIEDRDDMGPSYPQFLANLRDKIMGRHGST